MRYTLLVLIASVAFGQSAYKAPRTPWGVPELSGYYLNKSDVPLERPQDLGAKEFYTDAELPAIRKAAADRAAAADERDPGVHYDFDQFGLSTSTTGTVPFNRTSLIVGASGRLPAMLPDAAKRQADQRAAARGHEFDSVQNRSLGERCIMYGSEGPPLMSGGYNPNLQIFQGPNEVIIRNEMMGGARIIRTDGSPHLDASVRQWYGDSIGHWEGDTLVTDTTNFTDQPPVGRGASRNVHVTERFTRTSNDIIMYQFTVSDPSTWEKSWSGEYPIQKIEGPIYEYGCQEGNYGLANIITGARATEREAAAKQ